MKRWHLGCLFLLLIGLSGCSEPVYPPPCYHATFSLGNTQELAGMRVETDGYTLTIINTAAPTATVLLSDLYFTDRRSYSLAGQFPGTLRRATPDRLVVHIQDIKEVRDHPQYPNCDQPFPKTSPAIMLASHDQQRQLVTLRVTYHPADPEIITHYREYEREGKSMQRMIDLFFAFVSLMGCILFIGVILLLRWLAKKLKRA